MKCVTFSGIPCLLYGLAASQLIKHTEVVHTEHGPVTIYFLLPEHKGSRYWHVNTIGILRISYNWFFCDI